MKTKPVIEHGRLREHLEVSGEALHLASLHFFANLPPLFSFSQLAVSMSCPRCLQSIIVSAGDFFGWLPSFSSLFWSFNCFLTTPAVLSTFYTPILRVTLLVFLFLWLFSARFTRFFYLAYGQRLDYPAIIILQYR